MFFWKMITESQIVDFLFFLRVIILPLRPIPQNTCSISVRNLRRKRTSPLHSPLSHFAWSGTLAVPASISQLHGSIFVHGVGRIAQRKQLPSTNLSQHGKNVDLSLIVYCIFLLKLSVCELCKIVHGHLFNFSGWTISFTTGSAFTLSSLRHPNQQNYKITINPSIATFDL